MFLNIRIAKYYNFKRVKELTFKKGNKVFLLRKKLKIKRLNRKLDYVKIELFKVTKVVSLVNYKL